MVIKGNNNKANHKSQLIPIIIWCLLFALLLGSILHEWSGNLNLTIIDSCITFLLLFSFGFITSNVFNYYLPSQNRITYIFTMAAASSFISAVLFKSFWYFLLPLFQIKDYQSNFISSIPVRSAIYFFNIAVIAIYKMYEINRMDQNLSEQRKTETENLRKDAELLQLKYQLQPHFLFNSLNSINALIASKPQQAKEMVQLLADFLRGTLKSEENALIEVKEELDQINRYLAIEKVRFGHRLQTKLTIEADDLLQLKLPSMILQPIVENAIKFGLYATTEEVVIAIHIMEQPNGLYIHISNPFDETYKHNNSGIGFGISSIYRRLQLIYGRSDLFTTETINQTFIATLCIPK